VIAPPWALRLLPVGASQRAAAVVTVIDILAIALWRPRTTGAPPDATEWLRFSFSKWDIVRV